MTDLTCTRAFVETLKMINLHYGKGDINSVHFHNPQHTEGHCGVHMPYVGTEAPKFRVAGDFVTFRGKMRKIGYEPRYRGL